MAALLHAFPHPLLSVMIFFVWILLANEVTLGHAVLGAVLGWVIPRFTSVYWPDRPRIRRPGTVSADLSADGRALLVHCLEAPDPASVVATIKQRYERRLQEIFES